MYYTKVKVKIPIGCNTKEVTTIPFTWGVAKLMVRKRHNGSGWKVAEFYTGYDMPILSFACSPRQAVKQFINWMASHPKTCDDELITDKLIETIRKKERTLNKRFRRQWESNNQLLGVT